MNSAKPFTLISVSTDDAALRAILRRIVDDVVECFSEARAFPALGAKPLLVCDCGASDTPICIWGGLPHSYTIKVPLSYDYADFAYAAAHELGHVYCGPVHGMTWIVETLCEMASQICLQAIADRWAADTPDDQWVRYSYAVGFSDYLALRRRRHSGPAAENARPPSQLDRELWPDDGTGRHGERAFRQRAGLFASACIDNGLGLGILPAIRRCSAIPTKGSKCPG